MIKFRTQSGSLYLFDASQGRLTRLNEHVKMRKASTGAEMDDCVYHVTAVIVLEVGKSAYFQCVPTPSFSGHLGTTPVTEILDGP